MHRHHTFSLHDCSVVLLIYKDMESSYTINAVTFPKPAEILISLILYCSLFLRNSLTFFSRPLEVIASKILTFIRFPPYRNIFHSPKKAGEYSTIPSVSFNEDGTSSRAKNASSGASNGRVIPQLEARLNPNCG